MKLYVFLSKVDFDFKDSQSLFKKLGPSIEERHFGFDGEEFVLMDFDILDELTDEVTNELASIEEAHKWFSWRVL